MAGLPAGRISTPNAMGEALRRDGRRMTAQRALLLRIIEETEEHLDAEAIHRRAQERGARMSLSTVYRTLTVLAEVGLLRELHFDEEHHHFERSCGEHYQLYCLGCGQITEYWPPDGGRRLSEVAEQRGFILVSARLELQGFCPQCRIAGIGSQNGNSSTQRHDDTMME